jgi:hypothetical protein
MVFTPTPQWNFNSHPELDDDAWLTAQGVAIGNPLQSPPSASWIQQLGYAGGNRYQFYVNEIAWANANNPNGAYTMNNAWFKTVPDYAFPVAIAVGIGIFAIGMLYTTYRLFGKKGGSGSSDDEY